MNGVRRNEWLTPQTLMGIAGMLAVAFTAYQNFQTSTTSRMAALEFRTSALEKQTARDSERLDAQDKTDADFALALDRLKRR